MLPPSINHPLSAMIRSYKITSQDLLTGRKAFEVITALPTGRLAYAIARNAQEFRRVDKIFQDEAQRILKECAWTHDGDLIYGCANTDFDPERYVGEGEFGNEEEMANGDIFACNGHYWIVDHNKAVDLGPVLVNANGAFNVCMKRPLEYRRRIEALDSTEMDIQLTRIAPTELEKVAGVTADCFWVPMLDIMDTEAENAQYID